MSRNDRRKSGRRSSLQRSRTSSQKAPLSLVQQKHMGPHKGNNLGFVLMVGIALVLFFVFLTFAAHGKNTATSSGNPLQQSTSATGYGLLNQVKGPCGNTAEQPQCTVDSGWFSASLPVGLAVSSLEATTMVASSIAHSNSFTSMQDRFGYVATDPPVLVHAYQAHTGIEYYDLDHWVLSVRNTLGQRVGVFDFIYDHAYQRIRFSSFGAIPPQDPHSQMAFPYLSINKATALLKQQRGLNITVGSQSELIFFPLDPRYRDIASNQYRWNGGGDSPMNPLWYTINTNRQEFFVGADLHTYVQKDLPITSSP